MSSRTPSMIIALFVVALPAFAQEKAEEETQRPADWVVRFDKANASEDALYFVAMEPGWHITTGPAGIFYDPALTAVDEYRVESEIFLFDPKGRHREAYGIFIGGVDLESSDRRYVYFLIRNDGSYLIKERVGSGTAQLVGWTRDDSIKLHTGAEDPVVNTLAIVVRDDQLTFMINGREVTHLARGELNVNGVVGLRVNHSLNLHVSKLDVSGV